jgi:hypothetical protein
MIDATPFGGNQILTALGIAQGRTENDLGDSAGSSGKM